MTLDELLLEWSYRSERGYPTLDNPSDISILKQILKELDLPVNEIISNLEEAATTITEELHEVFVAIFVAGHTPLSEDNFNAIPAEKWGLDSLSLLIDPQRHIEVIKKWKDVPAQWDKKAFSLYQDAKATANQINSTLGYPSGLKGVSRVFPESTKPKGDIYTKQDISGYKDEVQISLKYGKGQFNSLSASELMGTIYNIPEDVLKRKGTGLLKQIYDKDSKYKDAIDKGVRSYVKFIIDNYEKIPEDKSKLKEGEKEILDNFDKSLLSTITWPEWRAMNKVHNAFKHAYGSFPLSTDKATEFIPTKREAINKTIQQFKDEHAAAEKSQEDIVEALKYVLGSDEKDSYFYVAEAGGKMTWIPSVKRLEANQYEIDENVKEQDANYRIDVTVKEKESGAPLFMFDILLRFAGAGGQYTTDLAQKGSTFKIFEDNFNRIFYKDS